MNCAELMIKTDAAWDESYKFYISMPVSVHKLLEIVTVYTELASSD
jgi:hypothetical protein